jgi:hypothetical protein
MSCHQSLQCNLQTKLQLAIQLAKWYPKNNTQSVSAKKIILSSNSCILCLIKEIFP